MEPKINSLGWRFSVRAMSFSILSSSKKSESKSMRPDGYSDPFASHFLSHFRWCAPRYRPEKEIFSTFPRRRFYFSHFSLFRSHLLFRFCIPVSPGSLLLYSPVRHPREPPPPLQLPNFLVFVGEYFGIPNSFFRFFPFYFLWATTFVGISSACLALHSSGFFLLFLQRSQALVCWCGFLHLACFLTARNCYSVWVIVIAMIFCSPCAHHPGWLTESWVSEWMRGIAHSVFKLFFRLHFGWWWSPKEDFHNRIVRRAGIDFDIRICASDSKRVVHSSQLGGSLMQRGRSLWIMCSFNFFFAFNFIVWFENAIRRLAGGNGAHQNIIRSSVNVCSQTSFTPKNEIKGHRIAETRNGMQFRVSNVRQKHAPIFYVNPFAPVELPSVCCCCCCANRVHFSSSLRFNVSCIGFCRGYFFAAFSSIHFSSRLTSCAGWAGDVNATQTNRINLNVSYSFIPLLGRAHFVFIYFALTLVSHDSVGGERLVLIYKSQAWTVLEHTSERIRFSARKIIFLWI